jgi:hypothetical protein
LTAPFSPSISTFHDFTELAFPKRSENCIAVRRDSAAGQKPADPTEKALFSTGASTGAWTGSAFGAGCGSGAGAATGSGTTGSGFVWQADKRTAVSNISAYPKMRLLIMPPRLVAISSNFIIGKAVPVV